MADRSLRGVRLGAQSLQSEEGVVFMERRETIYVCPSCGHETKLMFAADAEAPEVWECRCGENALLQVDGATITVEENEDKTARTHWDMLMERRTIPELEELLQERLDFLHARRGENEGSTV